MMLGNKAYLARRLPAILDHEVGDDRVGELAERICQRQSRLVVSNQADKNTSRAKRGDVAGDVAGTADFDFVMTDRKHRRRRFRRDAGDVAIDKIIKHDVANAEDGLLAEELERFLNVEHSVHRYRSARSRNDVT